MPCLVMRGLKALKGWHGARWCCVETESVLLASCYRKVTWVYLWLKPKWCKVAEKGVKEGTGASQWILGSEIKRNGLKRNAFSRCLRQTEDLSLSLTIVYNHSHNHSVEPCEAEKHPEPHCTLLHVCALSRCS